MILSREELAKKLNITYRYLTPSNMEHIIAGAKEKGYKLIWLGGKGKNSQFELTEINNNLEGEEWKNFPLSPDYQVSNFGRIKHPSGGILSATINKGYKRVRIKNMGQPLVHRMVMITFNPIDNYENYVVDHINGIRTDNRLCNLRWVYQTENAQFSDKNNTEIREIVAKLVQKYGYDEIKNKLNALLEGN